MTETFYHEKDGILNWNYNGLDLNESTSTEFWLSAKSSKKNNPFLFKSSCAVLCLRDIRYNKEIFIWWCSAKIVFHLSSSSYDGKLFSRFERIIFKLFRLWPLLANRPWAKRFVCRLWSSFVFRIAFPEYCKEHLVDYNYLKITTASLTQSVSQNVILTQNVIILANICKVRI